MKFPQLRTFSAPTQFPKRKEEEEEDLPFVRFPQNSFLFSFLPLSFQSGKSGVLKALILSFSLYRRVALEGDSEITYAFTKKRRKKRNLLRRALPSRPGTTMDIA